MKRIRLSDVGRLERNIRRLLARVLRRRAPIVLEIDDDVAAWAIAEGIATEAA